MDKQTYQIPLGAEIELKNAPGCKFQYLKGKYILTDAFSVLRGNLNLDDRGRWRLTDRIRATDSNGKVHILSTPCGEKSLTQALTLEQRSNA